MVNYNELFGGDTIAPAQLSYTSFEIDENLVLQWPLNADPDANFAAQKIDITSTVANLTVTIPPANEVSTGTDILFKNAGAQTFIVLDADGNNLGSVASGEAWYFYLTDNSDAAGAWTSVEFGAGTSSATAASLAGAGLSAIITTLNQNLPTTHINTDYSLGVGDRATVVLSEGGVTTLTPDSPATLGDGWFVYIINAGSGVLTFDGDGALVDGEASKTINPSESAIFFSDGANFWTLGYGRSIQSTVTATTINLTGETSPLTLSAAQVAAQVQDYTGTLTGNFIVNYGTGVGYWFIRNNTSGAFTLTLRVNGSDSGVVIPQGSYSIVRSNGSNLVAAFTATSGTVTQVNTGTGLTGGPVTTTGTISLANTAVSPGSYGSASETLTATVDQQGRLTALADTAIAITASQITDFDTAVNDEVVDNVLPANTWVIFDQQDVTNVSVIDFTSIPSWVNNIHCVFEVKSVIDGAIFGLRTYDALGNLDSGASDYAWWSLAFTTAGGAPVITVDTTDSSIHISGGVDNGPTGFSGSLHAENIQAATYTKFCGEVNYLETGAVSGVGLQLRGQRLEAARITGIRIFTSGVTLFTGKATLFVSI